MFSTLPPPRFRQDCVGLASGLTYEGALLPRQPVTPTGWGQKATGSRQKGLVVMQKTAKMPVISPSRRPWCRVVEDERNVVAKANADPEAIAKAEICSAACMRRFPGFSATYLSFSSCLWVCLSFRNGLTFIFHHPVPCPTCRRNHRHLGRSSASPSTPRSCQLPVALCLHPVGATGYPGSSNTDSPSYVWPLRVARPTQP